VNDVITGAVRGAVTQGIAVATGLQDKFSWSGVAAAGVGNAVGNAVGRALKIDGPDWEPDSAGDYGKLVVQGLAGAIANAATRSVIEGSDFGDNLIAALPDVIGNTLGRLVADAADGGGLDDRVKVGTVVGEVVAVPPPEAGREGTPNAAANTAVKGAEANATDQAQLGDIVVTARRRAQYFVPTVGVASLRQSPVSTHPDYRHPDGWAPSAEGHPATPEGSTADQKTLMVGGKALEYMVGGTPLAYFLTNLKPGDLEATLTDAVQDRIDEYGEDRALAESLVAQQLIGDYLTKDSSGNTILTNENAWAQYELSKKLRGLGTDDSSLAVRVGFAIDPGAEAGRRYVKNQVKEDLGGLYEALNDFGVASNPDVFIDEPGAYDRALARTTARGGALLLGIKDLFVGFFEARGNAEILSHPDQFGEERVAQAKADLAVQAKPLADALKLSVDIVVDAKNGSGFALGMAEGKAVQLGIEAALLKGAGKLGKAALRGGGAAEGIDGGAVASNAARGAALREVLRVTEAANPLVDSLRATGKLPSNFVTDAQARAAGWSPGKALENYIPGGQMGGDVFRNSTGVLPSAKGRVWYEADVGLRGTMSRSSQPGSRLLYSNDGKLFITTNHYETVHPIGTWK
jgi:ribonuclease